jgi:hypothetical protein
MFKVKILLKQGLRPVQEFDDYVIDQEIDVNDHWDDFKKKMIDDALAEKAKDRNHFMDFKKF